MKKLFVLKCFFGLIMVFSGFAVAKPKAEDAKYYRDLTLKVRPAATFKVPMIGSEQIFNYQFELAQPIYPEPIISDGRVGLDPTKFYRRFWDRIFLKDGSHVVINGEEIPLTCIFINGQDNRYAGRTDPRFPQFIMKVYLVANDYTFTLPFNPNFS